MKAPKEIKQWINNTKSWRGRRNGVVSYLWDAPRDGAQTRHQQAELSAK